MRKNYIDKLLVLCTSGVLAIVLVIFSSFLLLHGPSHNIAVDRQLAIGDASAKVQLVIFEEIRCRGCQNFNQKIFPQLKTRYIDTGKISYIVVPLSFFEGTKPAANAAISVYTFHPERFFAYIEQLQKFALVHGGSINAENLIQCAAHVGGIDLAHLKRAIQGRFFYRQLDKNLEMARQIMHGSIATPALYINGKHCPSHSAKEVINRIEQALQTRT